MAAASRWRSALYRRFASPKSDSPDRSLSLSLFLLHSFAATGPSFASTVVVVSWTVDVAVFECVVIVERISVERRVGLTSSDGDGDGDASGIAATSVTEGASGVGAATTRTEANASNAAAATHARTVVARRETGARRRSLRRIATSRPSRLERRAAASLRPASGARAP